MAMKLVVFDIDGTLVDKKTHQMSDHSKHAISMCQQAGVKVLLATGRTFWSIEDDIKEAVGSDGYVTINGQVNLDASGRILEDIPLDFHVVESFIEVALKQQWHFGFHMETKTVMYHDDFLQEAISGLLGHDAGIVQSQTMDEHLREHVYTMIASVKDVSLLEEFLQRHPMLRKDSFMLGCYDVFNGHADKYVGIEGFLKRWNLSWDEVAAFGDNTNDLGMLQKARWGYVVAGGPESMKTLGLPMIDGPMSNQLGEILIKHLTLE